MSKESDGRKRLLNGEKDKKTRYDYAKTTRVPKGEKDIWKSAADAHGKSLNQYVIDLIHTDNPDLFPAEDN